MPSRFYYRPVDPGYAQFGSTIANAVGAAGNILSRRRAEETEEERYREGIRRQDEEIRRAEERYQEQMRLERIARRRALEQQGYVFGDERAAARGTLEATPEGLTPGTGIYDSMGVGRLPAGAPGILAAPSDPRLRPIQGDAGGIRGAMQGAPAPADPRPTQVLTPREGATRVTDPEFGAGYFDPAAATESLKEEADFLKQLNRREVEIQRARSLIEQARDPESEGGEEITAQEMTEWQNAGVDPGVLADVLLVNERGKYASSGSGSKGITANRRLALVEDNILGDAMRLMEQNPDASLSDFVGQLMSNETYAALGQGAVELLVREAVTFRRLGITMQARNKAEQELMMGGIMPGSPGYRDAVLERAAEIQKEAGDAPVDIYSDRPTAAEAAAAMLEADDSMTNEEIAQELERRGYTVRREEQ
jgi:hypothetical protein